MPRPRSLKRKTHWHLMIDEDLANTIDILHIDPLTQRPRYGARAELISQLLRDWVETKRKEPSNNEI